MIPIQQLELFNCVFVFTPPATPPPGRGKQLTTHLLTADLHATSINLSGAGM